MNILDRGVKNHGQAKELKAAPTAIISFWKLRKIIYFK
jgi:hypothetical protein